MIEPGSRHNDALFRGLDVADSELASIEFDDCRFVNCTLSRSVLRACRFAGCAFEQCDLGLVRLPRSTFAACRFEDSKAIGVNWTEAQWPETRLWVPLGFVRCVISHSTFMGLDLRETRIVDCTAEDVDFRETDLTEADLSGTDLSGSLFTRTNLSGADLRSARNYRIDPRENVIRGARFSLPEAISLLDGLGVDISGWEP
jgi:fluoroquinolone resistance protein